MSAIKVENHEYGQSGNNSLTCKQEAIFRVVAAILHLGNIEFAKGEDNESSIVKDEESLFHLQMTSELLMYDLFFLFLNFVFVASNT